MVMDGRFGLNVDMGDVHAFDRLLYQVTVDYPTDMILVWDEEATHQVGAWWGARVCCLGGVSCCCAIGGLLCFCACVRGVCLVHQRWSTRVLRIHLTPPAPYSTNTRPQKALELLQELGDEAPPLEEAVQVRGGGQRWADNTRRGWLLLASSGWLQPTLPRASTHPNRRQPTANHPQVRPFNLRADHTRAIRDLDPLNLDTLVAVKGMVTRTGTIIPDLRVADFRCDVCNGEMTSRVRSRFGVGVWGGVDWRGCGFDRESVERCNGDDRSTDCD
jgi:hypothetical protein